MRRRLLAVAVGVAVVLAVAMPARAHHGGGASDQAETLEFAGTVTELQFANPHVVLFFDVTRDGLYRSPSGEEARSQAVVTGEPVGASQMATPWRIMAL